MQATSPTSTLQQRSRRLAIVLLALGAGPARVASSAPEGALSGAGPVVGIVNPGPGPVTLPFRVQVRIFSPGGQPIGSPRVTFDDGAATTQLALTRNSNYAPGAPSDSGIFEAVVSGPPAVAVGGRYTLQASAANATGTVSSGLVGIVVNASRGDGNLLVRDNSAQLCSDCHAHPAHSAEQQGTKYGSWYAGCRTCHTPHRTTNASLIAERITPPAVNGQRGPAEVRFSTRTGYAATGGAANPAAASYTNGDATGVCQACHTRTTRWRADGTPDPIHVGPCAVCHRHSTGFKGECGTCHPTPPGTGSHTAHLAEPPPTPPFPGDPRPLGCGSCHANAALHANGRVDVVLGSSLLLPGGTSTTGALATRSSSGYGCLTACHFPLGASAPAQPVRWGTAGPLPCTSCHSRIVPDGAATPRAGPSLHDPNFSEARPASGEPTTCYSCHDAAQHDATHLTGAPGLLPAGTVDARCITCHSPPSGPAAGPQGQVLHSGTNAATSKTPPILPGWSTTTVDATSGDFHGGRRGTCFGGLGPEPCAPAVTPTGHGGTLKAPYYRGYPAMPCASCHAGHSSANSFLFAASVNGAAIPPGSIDRTGVGAERLCEACHEGGRHDRCKACHTDAYYCDQNAQCWMDDAATHIDPAPAGSACFFCHGHEGILRWTSPYGPHGDAPTNCQHCHGGMGANGGRPPSWVPPRLTVPRVQSGPTVSGISWTSATLTWTTDVACSTWVEYGVGMPGYLTGGTAEVYSHAVTLTGLQPATTYVWRIRSVDAQRNAVRTALATFSTPSTATPARPDLVPVGGTGVDAAPSMTLALQWYTADGPGGHALEYRVQLGSDATFTWLANGAPADSGWVAGTPATYAGRQTRYAVVSLTNLPADDCMSDPVPANYYSWRVKARDAVTRIESDWSVVDSFGATSWDSNHCGY